ncbi:MAG: hypothetical protein OYM47_02750 [Gemmatimonadota bacterium]|nr:hypothetical protein [Gemmatimonadota bacterium]
MDKKVLENIACLEGLIGAQRLVLAMLIYAAHTDTPFDLIRKKIDSIYQVFEEDVQTLFPDQRLYFAMGMRSGLKSTYGLTESIAMIMAGTGHNTSEGQRSDSES